MNKQMAEAHRAWNGTTIMVLAALFYGSASTTIKLTANYLTTWQTAIGRFYLGLLLIPMMAGLTDLKMFGQDRRLLVIRGICGTMSFLLLVQAMKTVPLSVGMILFYLWPIFCCILSPWIAQEPISRREWPLVFGAIVGIAIIFWPDKSALGLRVGHMLALGSALFAGLAIILARRLGRNNHPLVLYFYFCIAGGAICTGPLLAQKGPILPASVIGWLGMAGVAVFSSAGQVFMNQGMKVLNASRTGVIMMIEPIFTCILGVVLLQETLSVRLIVGAGFILFSGVGLLFQSSGVERILETNVKQMSPGS